MVSVFSFSRPYAAGFRGLKSSVFTFLYLAFCGPIGAAIGALDLVSNLGQSRAKNGLSWPFGVLKSVSSHV